LTPDIYDAFSKVEGFGNLNRRLAKLPKAELARAKRIIDINARALQRYVRTERMTGGTTSSRLRVRTGRLRASVVPLKTGVTETGVEGGIAIGTVYSRVHVGKAGQRTIIKPKRKKYLTIPLPAAETKAGVLRGPALSATWGDTFIAKSKKGNLIIFGKRRYMKGKRQGELRKQVLPLFLLVKQVSVPSRIDPAEVLNWIKPKMIESFLIGRLEVE
jgi:hypothetical protein